MARLCRAGREAAGLEGVSPALRAWASNFSLRGQRKVTKRKATPANPTATRFPSGQGQGWTDRRRRHFGLRHPWLRPKSASNIPVLAPNRVELRSPSPDLAPVLAASAPSSLMALLTLPLPLGGLEGKLKPCPPVRKVTLSYCFYLLQDYLGKVRISHMAREHLLVTH